MSKGEYMVVSSRTLEPERMGKRLFPVESLVIGEVIGEAPQ